MLESKLNMKYRHKSAHWAYGKRG